MMTVEQHRKDLTAKGIHPDCLPHEYWENYAAKRKAEKLKNRRVLTVEEQAQRQAICSVCVYLVGDEPVTRCIKAKTCSGCHKSRLQNVHCPEGKW